MYIIFRDCEAILRCIACYLDLHAGNVDLLHGEKRLGTLEIMDP